MQQWCLNVMRLCGKEFRSLFGDWTLMVLIVFAFTAAIYSVANGVKAEVSNASVAIMDGDRSELSYRLRDAILPPFFKPPVEIAREAVDGALNRSEYIFVLDIPPNFEADLVAGRQPKVQLLVDATAMTQAGLGVVYLNQIFTAEVLDFMNLRGITHMMPVQPAVRTLYNPNGESAWFTSVMQIVTNITVLAIILVGAAVIREKEHGTIEHLLVMPVRPSEIAFAKILSNGLVIVVASLLSLWFVIHLGLSVPIQGSLWLFALGCAVYLFSVTALGILLATLAPAMPQFGLLAVPVYVVAYLLSGAATPVESMPEVMQYVVQLLPTTQFVNFTQDIVYRGAGIAVVWKELLAVAVAGVLFLSIALSRFRQMLARAA
ncbi:MAG: ABC transporter permease [Neisseriaceae bacterium]|nr:ABC transporter permease [Neisseriaceae bacterium]